MSEHLKRWSPTARMEEIGKRPVGYMIGDKRGQWCWADIAEKQIATLTAERDALSAVLQQGADADVDLRKRYEALEKENAELRAQVARLSAPVSELAEVSIKIRELNSTILTHRCTERFDPDYTSNDPGQAPCAWNDSIDADGYCDNCKLTISAKKERTKAKRRRSSLVRALIASRTAPAKEPA